LIFSLYIPGFILSYYLPFFRAPKIPISSSFESHLPHLRSFTMWFSSVLSFLLMTGVLATPTFIGASVSKQQARRNVKGESTAWSGLAYGSPPPKQHFTRISGEFIVSLPHIPVGVSPTHGLYGAAAWVGIDGDGCNEALIQTGVFITINNGVPSYSAFLGMLFFLVPFRLQLAFPISYYKLSSLHSTCSNSITIEYVPGPARSFNANLSISAGNVRLLYTMGLYLSWD